MVRCIVPSMQDGNGLMGWMDVICVICVAMNLWFLWFLWELVPDPSSARKPQPSLLQVLIRMQEPLLDRTEILFKWIGQCRTSFLANNLLECFPKSKNVQVGHSPRLPCIEHLRKICRSRSISRSCRTRLCIVLCRLLIQKEKYIQEYLNECSCLSRLFAFWILSYPFIFRKFTKLDSRNWSWTNSARLLELLRCVKVEETPTVQVSHLLLEWILDSYTICVLDTVRECTCNVIIVNLWSTITMWSKYVST